MSFKPNDYPSVSPYLLVERADDVVAFLEETFDAEVTRRYEKPDGSVMHLEVRIDDSIVMMGEPGNPDAVTPAMVHVYVDDVDRVYERGLEAGGSTEQEPTRRDGESDKRGGLVGPSGHTWWVSTHVD